MVTIGGPGRDRTDDLFHAMEALTLAAETGAVTVTYRYPKPSMNWCSLKLASVWLSCCMPFFIDLLGWIHRTSAAS